jgi:tetratricopeptide (TPR) repeat protein
MTSPAVAESISALKGQSGVSSKQADLPSGVTLCGNGTPPGDRDPDDLNEEARKLQESGATKFFSGVQKRSKAELEASANDLEKGLKIDPRMTGAYSMLAAYYILARRDPQTALRTFEEGLRHNPKSPLMHIGLGNLLSQHGEPSGAISHFLAALDLDAPCEESIYRSLGDLHFDQRNWKQAIANYQKALNFDSRQTGTPEPRALLQAQQNLALAYYRSGDLSAAQAAAKRLLEMDPTGEFGAWAREANRSLKRP